jgi:hypothetical protein
LALVAAHDGWAQSPVRPVVVARCTSGVSDGGYDVRVLSDGASSKLRADVYELSFFGTRPLGSVFVKAVNQGDGVEYVDLATGGTQFNLTIDFNGQVGSKTLRGSLRGKVNGKVIPPKEFPELGTVSCVHRK